MTTTTNAMSVGQQLAQSPAVTQALDAIVNEVQAKSAQITDVRGPIDGLSESYDAYLKRAAATRGKGLLYPYIGSGVGNGALVELMDGSVKWDMICGIGVNLFGHSDPDLVRTSLESSLGDVTNHGNLQSNWGAFRFSETLLELAGRNSNLSQAFISPTGALANENALKVCYQKHAPASRVIAFEDCFMGRTVTMAQIGDSAGARVGIPLSTQVDYMPFFDESEAQRLGVAAYIDSAVRRLQQYIDRYPLQHACFIFELVQGEGGFNVAKRDYFRALMECCKANSIAVWDDEIQTFGRTEQMFAYETFGVGDLVDIFCVGKSTQVCATLYTDHYAPKPGLLSGTFTGSGSAFDVGNRILERLRDGDYYGETGLMAQHRDAFREQVRALAARRPEWFPEVTQVHGKPGVCDIVGGTGGMMRMTPFGGEKAKVTKACRTCFEEGVILFYCGHGPFHLRMLPPLGVMKLDDWPRVFERVERGLAKAAG